LLKVKQERKMPILNVLVATLLAQSASSEKAMSQDVIIPVAAPKGASQEKFRLRPIAELKSTSKSRIFSWEKDDERIRMSPIKVSVRLRF
jgi:hypothetical protein